MHTQSDSRPLSVRILGVAMMLMLLSPLAAARPDAEGGKHWSEWNALGSGYVGRKRVPPKAELPSEQRRLATTQKRLQGKAQRGKAKRRGGEASIDQQAVAAQVSTVVRSETIDALWLRTGAAGLYGVSVADLATQLGELDTKVRRKAKRGKLSLTNEARPVSWHFDPAADMILFAAEAYDTFHSNENAYRFALGKTNANPMAVARNTPSDAFGDETPYPETLTFEEEPDLFFSTWSVASEPDADYWWWDYLYGGYKDQIEVGLAVPNPAADGTAQLRVTLRGWTDLEAGDEHQVYAKLNGVPVGPVVTWDGFGEALLVADFDQGLLDPDGNNTLHLRNSYTPGTHPGQWLDRIEIDYSRLPVAADGMLWMHDAATGIQTVTGFTDDDIMVIEDPAGKAVVRSDARIDPDGTEGWSVTFETVDGADYLIAERAATGAPTLAPDKPLNLGKRNNRADYLIIAPRDFTDTAEELAHYRGDRYRYVKIAWLDAIYSEFSHGREDPSAIARFMDRVVGKWRRSPSNVVLIGKGSLDHKDRMGYGDSFLPVAMTSTPWALAPSDDRLLGVEEGAPFAIGRLPITNDAEGMAYVGKLITYESTIAGDEGFEAVLVADNPDDAGDFHANSEDLADRLLNILGFDQVTTLFHPQDAVLTNLTLSETWETGYVSYDGHGVSHRLGDSVEDFLNAEDASDLQNAAYPLFTALTCAAGNDLMPGARSVVSSLVLNPSGGAIASMAPTGLSLDADARLLNEAFVDSLFGDNNTLGDAVNEAKLRTSGSISPFMLHIYHVIGEPGIYAR